MMGLHRSPDPSPPAGSGPTRLTLCAARPERLGSDRILRTLGLRDNPHETPDRGSGWRNLAGVRFSKPCSITDSPQTSRRGRFCDTYGA
ncbi:hypothetical protein ACFPRL_34715 [Pseudoclavibacter helvolus]